MSVKVGSAVPHYEECGGLKGLGGISLRLFVVIEFSKHDDLRFCVPCHYNLMKRIINLVMYDSENYADNNNYMLISSLCWRD